MCNDQAFWTRYSQYGITSGSFYMSVSSVPFLGTGRSGDPAPNGELDDSTIQNLIEADLSILPANSNYVNIALLPPGVGTTHLDCQPLPPPSPPGLCIHQNGSGFHGHFFSASTGGNAAYGVIEYGNSFTNTDTTAHEAMEAATDPFNNGYYSAIPASVP